uniref:ATP synthase complex subunit 8 n=1 Tax=Upogebia major TaxID=479409 RepID=K4EYB5_UPOMA|nr:ATP synthase F0 subunit 8 [Upogebia major]AEE64780.1 ATP synthase F0 subunit 8 [Upogebia major]AEW68287.1 ATP synthase F0 subunit 8 [Upogebia major]QPG85854.1 ATP synthase F0 subunit 8 [Upogebia major]
MPQMEPLLWLNLFFMFLISFSVYFVMNFYMTSLPKISSSTLKFSLKSKPWTW